MYIFCISWFTVKLHCFSVSIIEYLVPVLFESQVSFSRIAVSPLQSSSNLPIRDLKYMKNFL
jgi:hypothetical protein